MRDLPDFLSWTYDPEINRDRSDVVLDMLRFVREGLREQGGQPRLHMDFFVFENFVKAALFERLQSPMAKPVPKRMYQNAGDTVDLIVKHFERDNAWVTHRSRPAEFSCGRFTDAVINRLEATSFPDIDEENTNIDAAFRVAYANLARASTRLVLMHVIPELLKTPSDSRPMAWSTLREDLWIRVQGFQRDVLLFGALAGGELLKEAVRTVAPRVCYSDGDSIKFSLIQFLQRDGYSPGRWMSITEEGLEKDIIAAFKRIAK